jgi:tetratricopeptide (TPR) repeat protein
MTGPEQLLSGERAEAAGDYLTAAAAYRAVAALSDDTLSAEAYFRLGRVTWRQGRFEAALVAFESALALATRVGDMELWARVENGIGAVHYARGEYASARRAYAASLARTANDGMRGKTILNLGVIENIEGNFENALEHYERAYRLLTQSGDIASATLAVHNRGMVEADLQRWDAADSSYVVALTLASDSGNREMVAKTLVNRSELLVERGALGDAIDHCDRALAIYADVGDEVGRGEALRWRGHALGRAGEPSAAERSTSEALHIAVRSGARLLEAEAARDLGILRGMLGDVEGGEKLLRRAHALFVELGVQHEADAIDEQLRLTTPARTLARIPPS